MKTLLLCTTLFLANLSLACGYYPYGEDVRFKLMDPLVFGFRDYQMFNYTGFQFYADPNFNDNTGETVDSTDFGKIANAKLWGARCNQNVKMEDVLAAIYGNESFSKLKKSNSFIKDLYARNDKEALSYLEFARNCSKYNQFEGDPWSDNSKSAKAGKKMIAMAVKIAASVKHEEIKSRYYFLAIRMSYYAYDKSYLHFLFNKHFGDKLIGKNIIDYWALYFRTITEPDPVLRNYLSALVFMNAPDKRFMVNFQYDKSVDINLVLAKTKNNNEKEAVYLLDAIKTPSKCLSQIEAIQALNPNSRNLQFLLLREINKLEDWILTPSYTRFFPAAGYGTYYSETDEDAYLGKRIAEDKFYAAEIAKVLGKLKENEDNSAVVFLKMYTAFLSGNNSECIRISEKIDKDKVSINVLKQANYIKALAQTANQKKETATILSDIEPIVEKACSENNGRFLFALGRELEFKGNKSLAALCYWKIDNFQKSDEIVDGGVAPGMYWKSKKRNLNLGSDYFYEYFHYLDAEYTVLELQNLLALVENQKKQSPFVQGFIQGFETQFSKINDLIGTKYLRVNDLAKAENYFVKAGEEYYNGQNFLLFLASNPFYTNMYNEHTPVEQDMERFSKIQIVKTLQDWIKKSKNESNPAKDEASFIVANCYLNMTQYGNSWLMKHYFWTSNANDMKLEDDEEYFKCLKAKEYYLKASTQTKRKKFKALCLRMAGRCEAYKLWRETDFSLAETSGEEIDYGQIIFDKNKYFKQIKKEHASSYDDLISNCLSFESYYTSTN